MYAECVLLDLFDVALGAGEVEGRYGIALLECFLSDRCDCSWNPDRMNPYIKPERPVSYSGDTVLDDYSADIIPAFGILPIGIVDFIIIAYLAVGTRYGTDIELIAHYLPMYISFISRCVRTGIISLPRKYEENSEKEKDGLYAQTGNNAFYPRRCYSGQQTHRFLII